MKRFLSFMMALALLFSMSVNAFAEGETGSITITNATKGHNYSIYKIFDATFAVDDENNVLTNDAGERIIAYTISTDNQFFDDMFVGEDYTNEFFDYDHDTGVVTLKPEKNNETGEKALFEYLKNLVQNGSFTPAKPIVKADSDEVVFDEIPYGYYLIDKGNGAAVTIDSNTPDVKVIDKNQKPNIFDKKIWDEDLPVAGTEEKGGWSTEISSNVGDIEKFKLEFTATNYDGEGHIEYYSVKDKNGDALCVDFERFTVKVDGEALPNGYYYNTKTETGKYLNTWTVDKNTDNAQWYIIHTENDEFEVVLPWLKDHNFETDETKGFKITYTGDVESKYPSPVNVLIEYYATVEYNANIGNVNDNLKNTAHLEWTYDNQTGKTDSKETNIKVYALGLNKVEAGTVGDGKTPVYLEGAEFGLYRDEACENEDAVNVIPTNVKGVYIVDDLGTVNNGKDGESAREEYRNYLEAYLGANFETAQSNKVVTGVNGKIVIIGLKAGTYYLKETKAPDGYNMLNAVKKVEVGTPNATFSVVTDANGTLLNKQEKDENSSEIKYTYVVTETTVENSKGIELPSTGGEGTMRMITIGSIVAIAFAVLLITNKKMSVYQD